MTARARHGAPPDTTVEDVATLMVDRDVSRLPVLDGGQARRHHQQVRHRPLARRARSERDRTSRGAWVEVDLGAIARNVRTLKALTPPGTLFMAVVKADGVRPRGRAGRARGARAPAPTGSASRPSRRRSSCARPGSTAPIHAAVRAARRRPRQLLVRARRRPDGLHSRAFARALVRGRGRGAGRSRAYHLKVDTGMNRIGVRAEDAAEFARRCARCPGSRMEGVFTHFATADVPGDWEFERQLERFRDGAADACKTEGIDPGIVHAANSAATILHPETHFGMVRCGIAIYGLHPAAVDVRPRRAACRR